MRMKVLPWTSSGLYTFFKLEVAGDAVYKHEGFIGRHTPGDHVVRKRWVRVIGC